MMNYELGINSGRFKKLQAKECKRLLEDSTSPPAAPIGSRWQAQCEAPLRQLVAGGRIKINLGRPKAIHTQANTKRLIFHNQYPDPKPKT